MAHDLENIKCPIIGELAGHVTARHRTGILDCLARIKNQGNILDNFIDDGGIDALIKLLNYQSTKVLDCTLSILANVFLKSCVREKMRDTRIAHNVVWIIKNLTSGMTLHCRACRLIANMAESRCHAKKLYDVGVIKALDDIINSKANTQTLTMAIRAVRNMWASNEQSREQILHSNLIERVTSLLVTARTKYQDDQAPTKYRELAEACLKALKAFANSSDPRSIEQIQSKNDLLGYKTIIEFCRSNNRIAFQILHKLCQTAEHRPDLGSLGAIECLVVFLNSKSTDLSSSSSSSSSAFSTDVIPTLCLLSREAVNRARIRDSGGLELMLKLLADGKNECYHSDLLEALTMFVRDDLSIPIMIKNGLVNVLVDRLKRMVLDVRLETTNDTNCTRKRTAEVISPPRAEIKYNRTATGRFSLDFYSNDWSPRSANSPSSSPSSSPPLPYYTSDDGNDEEDNYSPVCSDDEDWDNEETATTNGTEEAESQKSYVSVSIGTDDGTLDNDEDTGIASISATAKGPARCTLLLLDHLTIWSDPIEGLADPTTIQALTAYLVTSKNFGASPILNRIIKKHFYFLPLLLQGFAFEAQSLDNSQDYLRIFRSIAESGGAFGDLAAILRRGPESDKLMVAISIPLLLRNREKLRMLLNNYGGLELIFRLLADQSHLLNENAILAICQLAEALGVAPENIERQISVSDEQHDNQIEQIDKGRNKNIVTFELDDGKTVDACKRMLCIKSQVFAAMLEGRFFEAGQKKVRLQNVSREGFATLCLAASGQLFNNNVNDEAYEIEALLDAVLLADKFLMFDESEKLTETSMSRLCHGNLSRAWNWARTNDCRELKICCVKNFLTFKLSREDRLCSFRNFSVDQNFKEFLNDIKDILMNELLLPH